MRWIYLLVFLAASAANAYTPEELLGQRDVNVDCKESVCTVSKDDLEWMVNRDRLLTLMAQKAYVQLQSCRGERAT